MTEVLSAADALFSVAKSQIGLTELPIGSNWGKYVKKYLNSVGINFPASWCMAFVYWCVDEACKQLGRANPLIKTGGVLHQWNEINAKYKAKTPQTGDIFIMSFGKGLGHTGFVERVDENFIYTIEGNSNDTGSREGIEVCRKQRPIKNKLIVGYIRIF
jgi:hypothetical protein